MADSTYLLRITASSGSVSYLYHTGNGVNIDDMATDSAGNIYIVAGGNLKKLNSGGTLLWTRTYYVTYPDKRAYAVRVDSKDVVYVAREKSLIEQVNASSGATTGTIDVTIADGNINLEMNAANTILYGQWEQPWETVKIDLNAVVIL
jgi:hypothetical protein